MRFAKDNSIIKPQCSSHSDPDRIFIFMKMAFNVIALDFAYTGYNNFPTKNVCSFWGIFVILLYWYK